METNNYFGKLSQVKCEVEKKNGLSYISWSDAWAEVKKAYPDSTYTIYENQDGNAFFESNYGMDCKVGVTINGIEHVVRLPVMDGANNSMTSEKQTFKVLKNVYQYGKLVYENNKPKKEEVEVIIEKATSFDINKTIQRAFTKAIAMHGIGLYVYRGEDLPVSIDDTSTTHSSDIPTPPRAKHDEKPANTKPYISKTNITNLVKEIQEGSIVCGDLEEAIKIASQHYIVADWAKDEIKEKTKTIFL